MVLGKKVFGMLSSAAVVVGSLAFTGQPANAAGGAYCLVTSDDAKVRQNPSPGSKVVSQPKSGQNLKAARWVGGNHDNGTMWVAVYDRTAPTGFGWIWVESVNSNSANCGKDAPLPSDNGRDMYYKCTTNQEVAVRENPQGNSIVRERLELGDSYRDHGWYAYNLRDNSRWNSVISGQAVDGAAWIPSYAQHGYCSEHAA